MNNNEFPSVEMQTPPPGVGARLRAAREANGQSVESVAHALRLSAGVVRALEADDRTALPADTFVRGYLRAYARVLDVDADELVRDYQSADDAPALLPNITRPQVRSSDAPVRLFTYLVVLGLLGLLVAWWITQGSPHFESNGSLEVFTSSEVEVGDGGGFAVLRAPTEEDAGEDEAPAASPPDEPAASAPPPETTAATPARRAAQAPSVEVPAAAPASSPGSVTASVPEPAPERASQASPSANAVPLVLRYRADSWTEVTDATGARLAYDLVREGRELRLAGDPPFTVFLGYSPGVQMSYDGASFDQSRYNRANNAARFQVGSPRTITSGN